jgi:hypothetical protein
MQWLKRLFEHGDRGAGAEQRKILVLTDTLPRDGARHPSKLHDEVENLSSVDPEERAWVKWFNQLPESHKHLVETSLHHGISVRPDNFERLLPRLRRM